MLAGEHLLRNTLNIHVVYARKLWQSITCLSLPSEVHSPGKRNTQKIERKHLTLRTRMKRLVRKTICFSKSLQMHDLVIGVFVNRYAFGQAIETWLSPL